MDPGGRQLQDGVRDAEGIGSNREMEPNRGGTQPVAMAKVFITTRIRRPTTLPLGRPSAAGWALPAELPAGVGRGGVVDVDCIGWLSLTDELSPTNR
jgi:hypothetical protein